MKKPVVDLKVIESEFRELAGHIPFRKHKGSRCLIKETDNLTLFNPKLVRTPAQLDGVKDMCRLSLTWGQ